MIDSLIFWIMKPISEIIFVLGTLICVCILYFFSVWAIEMRNKFKQYMKRRSTSLPYEGTSLTQEELAEGIAVLQKRDSHDL